MIDAGVPQAPSCDPAAALVSMEMPSAAQVHDRALTAVPGSPLPPDQFPIFLPGSARAAFADSCPGSVPLAALLAVDERRVRVHHGVTLQELAERGGLDPREIRALFVGVKLRIGGPETMHDGVAFVQALVAGARPVPAPFVGADPKPPIAKLSGPVPEQDYAVVEPSRPAWRQSANGKWVPITTDPPPLCAHRCSHIIKAMRDNGPMSLSRLKQYSGATLVALRLFLARHPEHVIEKAGLYAWVGPAEIPVDVPAIAPTETQTAPPLPARPGPKGPSEALVRKRGHGGNKGIRTALRERYRDIMIATGPAPVKTLARLLNVSRVAVANWLCGHPDDVARSDSYPQTWEWVGSRISAQAPAPAPVTQEHRPTDHVPAEPNPYGPVLRPAAPPAAAQDDDLDADEDLVALIAPEAPQEPSDTVPVPKPLLAGIVNARSLLEEQEAVQLLIEYLIGNEIMLLLGRAG